MQQAKSLSVINQVLYLIFFTSLICSFRAVSSISIALILVTGIVKNKLEAKTFFHPNLKNPFLISCSLLFLMHIVALAYTRHAAQGWDSVWVTSGLLFTPLAICCTSYINSESRQKLLTRYCLILVVVCLFFLCNAAVHYLHSGDPSVFFYHSLVSPFHQHAVYYSILVFIALTFLIESILKNSRVFKTAVLVSFIIFLSLFLFLLSSKLVIIFYLVYLAYHFVLLIKKRTQYRTVMIGSLLLLIIISSLTLIVPNPVSNRFYDIFKGDLTVIRQDNFTPGNYFNGLQFRLLQWDFTAEILNENNAWWSGVGPADAQPLLDQKYISKNMYTGDPAKGTKGYLGYNTHNQFLETLLQFGVPGLIILLAACFFLIRMAWQKKRRILSSIIALLLIWLFTESVLERQFGIMIFTFFPLFFSPD